MTVPRSDRRRRQISPTAYRRIAAAALAALSAIIVTGAAVRLTGSGLGCSDWPTCEENQFHASLELHPMVEFVNRLITGVVSAAVIAAVLGSMRRTPRRRDLTQWSWVLVAGVVAQIVIGAFVTLSELEYSVVAVHFLVSMVLVWAAMVLWDRSGRADDDQRTRRWPVPIRVLTTLSTAVLITGSMVTSAGPHSGDDEATKRLPIDLGQTARVHSVLVWITLALTAWLAVSTGRGGNAATGSPRARRAVTDLLLALVAQGAVGYVQYFTGVPELLVGVHVAGATAVWILVLRLAFVMAEPRDVPADDSDEPSPHRATTSVGLS